MSPARWMKEANVRETPPTLDARPYGEAGAESRYSVGVGPKTTMAAVADKRAAMTSDVAAAAAVVAAAAAAAAAVAGAAAAAARS